jgi:hypothetical protein
MRQLPAGASVAGQKGARPDEAARQRDRGGMYL